VQKSRRLSSSCFLAILSGAKLATIILFGSPDDRRYLHNRSDRAINISPFMLRWSTFSINQLLKKGLESAKYCFCSIGLSRWVFGIISLFLNSTQKLYVFIGIALSFLVFFIRFSRPYLDDTHPLFRHQTDFRPIRLFL